MFEFVRASALLFIGILAAKGLSVFATQWEFVVQTCDKEGAGTNAAVFLKVYYSNHDQQSLLLDSEQDDFEQASRDHFRINLNRNDIYRIGMFWWPSGTLREELCIDWALLLNGEQDKCYAAMFNKWIGHHSEPPTYPDLLQEMDYAACINAPNT